MATETLYATSHITGNILNPDNALGNTPTTWAGVTNTGTSETSRFAIGDPVNALTAGYTTHTISAVVRKGTNSGNPSAAINLYENGTLVKALSETIVVTSTTGQTLSGTFTTAQITNPANIEVEVVFTHVGGNPSTRNSPQLSHIAMVVDTTFAVTVVERTGSISGTSTLSATGHRLVERTGTIVGSSTLSGDGSKLVPAVERTGSIGGVSTLTGDGQVVSGWTLFSDGVNATTGATVTGLTNGTSYEFRVAAVNSVGQGAWSNIAGPYIPASGTGPVLKRWNGSTWVAAVVKHGSGWPTVSIGSL